MQAIVLLEKIKLLDAEISKRKKIFNHYYTNLSKINGIQINNIKKGNKSNYSVLSILVKKNRSKFIKYLKKNKIPTTIYYPKPLDTFKIFNKTKKITPISLEISKKILSLPMSAYLSKSKQEYIISKIKQYFL